MQSFPIPVTPINLIVNNKLPSQKTTTYLYSDGSHLYHYWTLNDRFRSKHEKATKRQQSSCRIAFYSVWLCIIAGVTSIIVYRYTEECPMTTNRKEFLLDCLRHQLFLTAICISFLACSGFIFGACRYFRSQPQPFLYNHEHELYVTKSNDSLPTTTISHLCYYPTSSPNCASSRSSLQTHNDKDKYSNTTVLSSITNISAQRITPPFNYDELPSPPSPNIISKSSNTDNNKIIFFSSSTSTLSSPPSIFSTTSTSNCTNTVTTGTKSKAGLVFDDACPSTRTSYTTCKHGTDIWEKQRRPSSTAR